MGTLRWIHRVEERAVRFLSVRDLRSKSSEVWKRLEAEREMVLTSNGRPVAVLSAISEDTVEETLAAIRRARAVATVSEAQRRAAEQGKDAMSAGEIEAEIAAARSDRRRATLSADRPESS